MRINPDKLVRDFRIRTSVSGELLLYWDLPKYITDGEEIVVVRRKDAFPVELRNPNFEDRYTDVAQVEVFRGSPIYCSNLIVGDGKLTIGSGNTFLPAISEFSRDNKYTGRLIRDSLGQVFKITDNTDSEILYQNISSNPLTQVVPASGPFIILADFPKQARSTQTLPLLANAYTLTVESNSFTVSDTITLNNTRVLTYGTDFTSGATVLDTVLNIQRAINNSGVKYLVTVYGNTLLIEKGVENTLAVDSNSTSLVIVTHAASKGKLFIQPNTLSDNEIRHLVIQDGDLGFSFVRSNQGKMIELYSQITVPSSDFTILNSFNNTFPIGYKDNYKGYLEALTKSGPGLEDDTFYYYTAFTTPLLSQSITYNEESLGSEIPLPYTIDKLSPYYVRIFYETIIHTNSTLGSFSYDISTGTITYSDGRDLSESGILVGDLFADSTGSRFTITDISQAASGVVQIAPASNLSTDIRSALHGSITRAQAPVGFNNITVGDTFKDIAGSSFPVVGTLSNPLPALSIPPSNSFDVSQGLIDEMVALNPFLVNYSYNPVDGAIQYGERVVAQNNVLSPFTYNSISGIVQYQTNINLNSVEINQFFVDGANNLHIIRAVNPALLQITLDPLLSVNNTVSNRRQGSVVEVEGYRDQEGNLLVNLAAVAQFDIFKPNPKGGFVISDVDATNGMVFISPDIDNISLVVSTEFDGSIVRRGLEVAWVGFDNELAPTLTDSNLGAVRRYGSVTDVQFAYFSNTLSTQSFAINAKDHNWGKLLYKWWPQAFRTTDETGDLEDLMATFGHEFNELYALINNFELQNASLVTPSQLERASDQQGLSIVSESLGIDTRRRIMRDLISCWKLKGNRDGIAKFIKVLTTWDITNGTGDTRGAITDDTPDTVGLRFYSPSLGTLNTRLVDSTDVQSPPAGRFYKGVPGLSLSGFFETVEIIINLPNVALHVGTSTNLSYFQGTSIIGDNSADFGQINSLKGCYLIPLEGNPNDYYEILSNTSDTITVSGAIPVSSLGGKYLVLSPLNLNRFVALQASIPAQLPFNAIAVFNFIITTI